MLEFGTRKMQTYVGDMVIHDVHHPAKVQKQVLSILRDKGITTTPYPDDARKSPPHQANDETNNETDEEDIEAIEEI